MLTVLHTPQLEKMFYALRLSGNPVSSSMCLPTLKNKGPEERTVAERTAVAPCGPISGVPTVVTKFPRQSPGRQPHLRMWKQPCRRRNLPTAQQVWLKARPGEFSRLPAKRPVPLVAPPAGASLVFQGLRGPSCTPAWPASFPLLRIRRGERVHIHFPSETDFSLNRRKSKRIDIFSVLITNSVDTLPGNSKRMIHSLTT